MLIDAQKEMYFNVFVILIKKGDNMFKIIKKIKRRRKTKIKRRRRTKIKRRRKKQKLNTYVN